MSDISTATLGVGYTATIWTDIVEFGVVVTRIEARVTILAINDESVDIAIEQTNMNQGD